MRPSGMCFNSNYRPLSLCVIHQSVIELSNNQIHSLSVPGWRLAQPAVQVKIFNTRARAIVVHKVIKYILHHRNVDYEFIILGKVHVISPKYLIGININSAKTLMLTSINLRSFLEIASFAVLFTTLTHVDPLQPCFFPWPVGGMGLSVSKATNDLKVILICLSCALSPFPPK